MLLKIPKKTYVNTKEAPVVSEPVTPVEPAVPVEEPDMSEVLSDPDAMSYAPYKPGLHVDAEKCVVPVIVFMAVLVVLLFLTIWMGGLSSTAVIYHTDITAAVEIDEQGCSVLVITAPGLRDPYIDIYADGELLSIPVELSEGSYRYIVEPGSYLVHVVSGQSSCIYYGIISVDVGNTVDLAGLTTSVVNYINSLRDTKKAVIKQKLYGIFKSASEQKTEDVDALLESIKEQARKELGFDSPRATVNEHEWQGLLGQSGVISMYLLNNDIEITKDTYSAVLKGYS